MSTRRPFPHSSTDADSHNVAPAARDQHRIDLHTDGVVTREQHERWGRHLRQDGRWHVEPAVAQVARIIGEELPTSAYKHSAWWAGDFRHTQAVRLDADYTVRLALPGPQHRTRTIRSRPARPAGLDRRRRP
ncbi:DUF7662 domain-containing protein [Microbispora sp. NPDC004025]